MKHRNVKNMTASVRQRLLNVAHAIDLPFDEILHRFAMERFIYRLSQSSHRDRFVLKGALMLAAWDTQITRPTRDIDVLGHMDNDIDAVSAIVREVCTQKVDDDGIVFDPKSVQGDPIAEEAEYTGVRVRFKGRLGTARIGMQIDVGFGDPVVPAPITQRYPVILEGFVHPLIHGYTRESMIAEKFHTMVLRGMLNSRMRDIFDVWSLARQFEFEGAVLSEAIRETFSRRDLEVPARPLVMSEEFVANDVKATQWRAFVMKSRLVDLHADLATVIEVLKQFLGPVSHALNAGETFDARWEPPGPWSPSRRGQ